MADVALVIDNVAALLADHVIVTAVSDGQGQIDYTVEAEELDDRFAGRRFRLRVGTTVVLQLKFPDVLPKPARRFGPSKIPITSLRRNTDFTATLIDEDSGAIAEIAPQRLIGDPFEAAAITDVGDFLVRVQDNHTKFPSPDVLTIGAKSFYGKIDSIELKAACLTILFHRVIWQDRLSEADIGFLRWLVGQSRKILRDCRQQLKAAAPTWELVRWTVSLATTAGHGALVNNDPDAARDFYAIAGGQLPNLKISAVSGLNVINGCFFSGLLAAVGGNMEMARKQLRNAVNGLRHMVDAQDLLANIWVTGDILDAGRTSRQAVIALVRLGLAEPPHNDPMISAAHQLDIKAAKSPVGKLAQAGFCKDTWEKLESMLDREAVR